MNDVNWVKEPISPDNGNCRPVFNYPEMDVVYDRVTQNIAPSLDGGKECQSHYVQRWRWLDQGV